VADYDDGRNPQDYGGLCRDALEQRLRLAENACVMFGWTAGPDESPRAKAAHQVWSEWAHHVGGGYTGPDEHPELSAAEADLAAERDRIRAETLVRIRGVGSGV
jgi:hypothetical protein